MTDTSKALEWHINNDHWRADTPHGFCTVADAGNGMAWVKSVEGVNFKCSFAEAKELCELLYAGHAELAEAKAEIERLNELLDSAEQACEDRADLLDDMGLEVECCVATARNCADDIRNLRGGDECTCEHGGTDCNWIASTAPITPAQAAIALQEAMSNGLDPFDVSENLEMESLAIRYAGNRGDAVVTLEIAEKFMKAALKAIAEEGE